MSEPRTIAIIGAGYSGIAAAETLVRTGINANIGLIERSGRFATGMAYGTNSASHLLNVPAGRMSARADDPDHFLRWIRQRDPLATGGSFVPRGVYGQYLQDVLADAELASQGRLKRIVAEARSISPRPGSPGGVIELSNAQRLEADHIVLAMGNGAPSDPSPIRSVAKSPRYLRDPWAPGVLAAIHPDERLAVMGTGLTMLDVVLDLTQRGHRGEIIAFSRRGLLPQAHRANPKPAKYDPPAGVAHWPRTARGLLRAVRAEIAAANKRHVDWREVITSLRPVTASLWTSLPDRERRRFLEHVRAFWEVARHRAAPQADGAMQALMLSGRLVVQAARLDEARESTTELRLTLRPRGSDATSSIAVDRLINCTGPEGDLARSGGALGKQLAESGLITPDPLGHGILINATDQPIGSDGHAKPWLWAIGPMTKSRYWESTAVPELRVQAQALANRLTAALSHAG